ncbi:hypothetical protein FQR65_LT08193 [Abscondita terminalis]|nr:hypothetical protein FQR65_LT08193 [Abscondita terminalis]
MSHASMTVTNSPDLESAAMGLKTEDFVAEFHNLSGLTVGESKKNLYKLLNDNVDNAPDFSQLIPQSLFEQAMKFEILKFYKNHDQLLEMIKDENPAVIEKILNLNWFIKETFTSMEPKRLTTEIFPKLSYNSKVKLLHKISLLIEDSTKCQEYFWSINETYGKYLALKLLPACSETLILQIMEDDRVELTANQLLLMIQRNPSKTENFFEILHSYDRNVNIGEKYRYVLKHLMQNDPSLFIRLNEKYGASFKLGSRTTRKFIANNKEICLDKSEKLFKLLKESEIGQCLKGDFFKFYSKIFPKSLEKLIENFDDFTKLLKSFKDEDKLHLLLDTFKDCYGEDLLDHHQFMVPKIFQWMPSDYKDRWLKNHTKPSEVSEETWISFMETQKSITLLKDQISLSSNVKQREKLVKALVDTCKINKDEDAFEEVCEYMVNKHRNDQSVVRRAFLSATTDNFNLRKLQERHWKHLNVLVHHCLINDDCYWLCKDFFENYLRLCFNKNLPYMDCLKLWVQHASYYTYCLFDDNLKYKKMFYEMIADALPLCFKDEELQSRIFTHIWNVSSTRPNRRISLMKHKHIVDTVLEELNNPQHVAVVEEFAMICIRTDFEKATELKLFEVLAHKSESLNVSVNIEWLLKYHSLEILPYIQPLMKRILKTYLSNHKIFKQVVSNKMKEAIRDVCTELLQSGEDNVKTRSLRTLSAILPSKELLEILEENRPQDLFDEQPSISKFQKSIPMVFVDITPAHITIEPVLQYCQGDYLKWTQNVLHQVCNNIAEERLGGVITSLSTRAVSVRKHSILLALKLLNKTEINTILKNFMDNEKNSSIRKHMFTSVFKLFLRNPDDYSWQLVKDNIKAISNEDTEAFCNLANSKRISKKYFVRYLLFTWKTLDALPMNEKLEEAKSTLLEAVTQDNVALLPNEFCLELIQNNLFQKTHPTLVQKLNDFTSKYLIYSGYDCVDHIFSVIKKFSKTSCKSVHNFVKDFCQFFITKNCDKVTILTSFAAMWDEIMKPYESLENYLYIHFTLMFMNSLNHKSIEEVGRTIAEICNSLFDIQCLNLQIFKDVFLTVFKDSLLEEMTGNLDTNFSLLIDSIVKNGNSNASLTLALDLIPLDEISTLKARMIYDGIVETAGRNSNPGVQVQLHHYLINKQKL